jgi:hypothetical protein
MNVMPAVYGTKGRFLRAGLATYRSVFPRVEIFKLNDDPESVGNVIIVAFKTQRSRNGPVMTRQSRLTSLAAGHGRIPMDVPILTDDYAPAEVYMMRWFF